MQSVPNGMQETYVILYTLTVLKDGKAMCRYDCLIFKLIILPWCQMLGSNSWVALTRPS